VVVCSLVNSLLVRVDVGSLVCVGWRFDFCGEREGGGRDGAFMDVELALVFFERL